MKKLFLLTLAALLAFSLAVGCGRNDNRDEQKDPGVSNGTQNGTQNGNGQNDMNNAGNDIADGAGQVVDGTMQGVRGLWNGVLDFFGGNEVPRTSEDKGEIFGEYGVDKALLDDYILHAPAGEDDAHEFFIAKVKEGKMAEVEEALEARRDAIAENWAETELVGMDYAREPYIIKSGNYIMLAVHDSDPEELRAEFERLVAEMEEK